MIIKVVLGTMQNAKKLVSIAESVPYEVELCNGRYVVNAKFMLGVLSLQNFDMGELRIHTDNEKECEKIVRQLEQDQLLPDTKDIVCRSIYDVTVFGEILIDFTSQGYNEDGQMLYARNLGGAPANVAVAAGKLGARTAFMGKAGKDMHGEFLRSVLQKENSTWALYPSQTSRRGIQGCPGSGGRTISSVGKNRGCHTRRKGRLYLLQRRGLHGSGICRDPGGRHKRGGQFVLGRIPV